MDKKKLFETLEALAGEHVQEELASLREFKGAIQNDPNMHELYFGHYHGEHSAMDLIGTVITVVTKELCHQLDVKSYCGYESDGGLDEAIAYDISAILQEARVMSTWDGAVSRHPEDRDTKLEEAHNAARAKPSQKCIATDCLKGTCQTCTEASDSEGVNDANR